MAVERSADPQQAAERIMQVAVECGVNAGEVIGLLDTVAGKGSVSITRDRGRDLPRVAHEIGMHVCPGGSGAPYRDVAAALSVLGRKQRAAS
ncbi:hypothetical protein DI005_06520 [Prauserella sp. PE36]|uniref:hypothetical protein n=1 Tax=Prauserella sp. PE36 TaxID=1504709 RepID=UPI000DE2AAC5|nr:hypothetical protein [Prauserella sp. PE36]RBM22469.1 hypothetical protein DI005_06520 [Prauserella sp. PE36]